MDNFSKKMLLDTVDTAIEYSSKLEDLLKSVKAAQKQVTTTAEESCLEIDKAFGELANTLLITLNERREVLKNRVIKIRNEGLAPLKSCQEVIHDKLKTTQNYICEGQSLLEQKGNIDIDQGVQYFERSALLGSLPAVPNLEEVPAVTFHIKLSTLKSCISSTISSAGTVCRIGPVQVSDVIEKPGALLVCWEELESERPVDVQSFLLQMAVGSYPGVKQSNSEARYRDVYSGPETTYMIRDLYPGQHYTLRVCCKTEDGKWSAWSLPHVAVTNIKPYGWDIDNSHYMVSVGGKIATKSTKEKCVLLSSFEQVGHDDSVEFTILECKEPLCFGDGLALVDSFDVSHNTLVQNGVLFVSMQGVIYVDGKEKTTRLPALKKGSRITFTCEPLSLSRVRVNIDCGDKAVTYDWTVKSQILKFGVLLTDPSWKIMVE